MYIKLYEILGKIVKKVLSFDVCYDKKVSCIKTIMIVDDEPEVLEKVKSYLDDNEFDVVTAMNSRQALEILDDEEDENVDLILVNTQMPGSNKNGFFSMKPKSRAHTAKTDAFLQKPFTREQLRDFVRNKMK